MEDIPDNFWLGIEQFNQRQFYDCHDTLEAIWIDAIPAEKNFYQGILQIAVAFHHLSNHNWRGSVILMGEGANRLRAYQPSYHTIDVEQLLQDTLDLLHYVQQAGPEQIDSIAAQLATSAIAPPPQDNAPMPTFPIIRKVAEPA